MFYATLTLPGDPVVCLQVLSYRETKTLVANFYPEKTLWSSLLAIGRLFLQQPQALSRKSRPLFFLFFFFSFLVVGTLNEVCVSALCVYRILSRLGRSRRYAALDVTPQILLHKFKKIRPKKSMTWFL